MRDVPTGWLDAGMTDWSALQDACGGAAHVPALLERFADDPSDVWSELMDHLCPQADTAYSASYAALPRLAGIAATCRTEHLGGVLLAAGAIVACAPGRPGPRGRCTCTRSPSVCCVASRNSG